MALTLPSLIHITDGTFREQKSRQGEHQPSLNQVCLQLVKNLQVTCNEAILGTNKSSYTIQVHCIKKNAPSELNQTSSAYLH